MCFLHVWFCSVLVRETELWLTCSVWFSRTVKHCFGRSLLWSSEGLKPLCILVNHHWHELWKQEKCSSLAQPSLAGFQINPIDVNFNQCMQFKNFWGQITSFEVFWKCHKVTLSKKCLRLRPSAKTADKSG